MPDMRLLLISNSTRFGERYLDHCADAIADLLGKSNERVLFVPYALHDHETYAANARSRFELMGYGVDSVHDADGGPVAAVERAQAIFIGGGNTFRLIDALWRNELVEPIRRRVRSGMPFIGTSAGTNVACPSIRTTNDMPIVQPPSFAALEIVPFQINPHYQDPIAGSTHMGETREQRIAEFHEENTVAVVGLREGAWLHLDEHTLTLEGKADARLFRRGQAPVEYSPGSRLDFLLDR
jgi:dipeptidase E